VDFFGGLGDACDYVEIVFFVEIEIGPFGGGHLAVAVGVALFVLQQFPIILLIAALEHMFNQCNQ
jgi:hypothetical protein